MGSGTLNTTDSEDRNSRNKDRPCRGTAVREFPVRDEIVIVSPRPVENILDDEAKNRALALNRSGRAIWELCDGQHSTDDIVRVLSERFAIDPEELAPQVTTALTRMSTLGFLDGTWKQPGTGTTFVIGIEDKSYFWWQTAIFLESLCGKLPEGWQTLVVVCNDGEPLSDELRNILNSYDTAYAEGRNHAKLHRLDVGNENGEFYAAVNRVEALSVAAGFVSDHEIICLLDSDTFVYGDLNVEIMPTQCAAPRNWHIEQDRFFSTVDKNRGKGIDLRKILEAIGCDHEFEPGGVNVFVTGEVAKNRKFIADCFRFAHALYLLGRTAGAEVVWMAEMPCFALAMTANGIRYQLLEQQELLVSSSNEKSIPIGTIYHYYNDLAESDQGAFHASKWHKQAYLNENFLRSDIEKFSVEATTDHERYFFGLATEARQRLYV